MSDRREVVDRSITDDLRQRAKGIILANRGPGLVACNGVFAGLSFRICYSESEGVIRYVSISYKEVRMFEQKDAVVCRYTPGVWEESFVALHAQLTGGHVQSRTNIRPGVLSQASVPHEKKES